MAVFLNLNFRLEIRQLVSKKRQLLAIKTDSLFINELRVAIRRHSVVSLSPNADSISARRSRRFQV